MGLIFCVEWWNLRMEMEPCRRRSSGQWWGRSVRISKLMARFSTFWMYRGYDDRRGVGWHGWGGERLFYPLLTRVLGCWQGWVGVYGLSRVCWDDDQGLEGWWLSQLWSWCYNFHKYGHGVIISGKQPLGFAKCIISERIREGNCPRTETGFSGFRQGSIRNLAMANIFLNFWRWSSWLALVI